MTLSLELFGQNSGLDNCGSLIGDCSYYSCKARQLGCGPRNYLISFGQDYCQRYRDSAEAFSPKGRQWLVEVRGCLQSALQEEQGLACRNTWPRAVETHTLCYLKTGFCDLPQADKDLVARIARAEVVHPDIVWQLIKITVACRQRGPQ